MVAEGPRGSSRAEKTAKPGDSITIELAPLGTLIGQGHARTARRSSDTRSAVTARAGGADRSSATRRRRLLARAPRARRVQVQRPGGSPAPRTAPSTFQRRGDARPRADGVGVDQRPGRQHVRQVRNPEPRSSSRAAVMAARRWWQAMTGTAPKTDANGRFTLPKVGNGKGALMVMPNEGVQPSWRRSPTRS